MIVRLKGAAARAARRVRRTTTAALNKLWKLPSALVLRLHGDGFLSPRELACCAAPVSREFCVPLAQRAEAPEHTRELLIEEAARCARTRSVTSVRWATCVRSATSERSARGRQARRV